MLVTYEPSSLAQFQKVFDRLWERCANLAAAPRRK
jgi:hypothetical protein